MVHVDSPVGRRAHARVCTGEFNTPKTRRNNRAKDREIVDDISPEYYSVVTQSDSEVSEEPPNLTCDLDSLVNPLVVPSNRTKSRNGINKRTPTLVVTPMPWAPAVRPSLSA